MKYAFDLSKTILKNSMDTRSDKSFSKIYLMVNQQYCDINC